MTSIDNYMLGNIMSTKPICTLEDVEKKYHKGSRVLGPISFSIYPGEIIGLRGHNGAGKSTTLKILAGVTKPSAGRCIRSKNLGNQIAYLPQDVALYSNLSGLNNLKFWGAVYGLPRKAIDARSHWLLDKMELSDKANQLVSAYSGGMLRKLHLASALMITPKLLLLDEPTVGADLRSVKLILSTLEELRKQGCAMMLVTHQSGEMEQVCDRILTLDNGFISDGGSLS